jgi:flagellar protein FlaG
VVQTAIAATPVGAAQSGADATQAASGFQADHASVQKAVDEINQAMKALAQEGIEFTIDKDTKFDVVKIIDKETNQVIRQLPSQTTIEIAKALDKLQGLLIKQEA